MTGGSLNMPVGKDVTLYYAPWCGHCKNLMPEWVKVEHALKAHPHVRVNKINSEENPHLAHREGVKGYPTIILQTEGKKTQYKGDRTANDIISFVLN
jgi:protein disulfide-isomerase-like protein